MASPTNNPIRLAVEQKLNQALTKMLSRAEEAATKSEQVMLKILSTKIPTSAPPTFEEFTVSKWRPKKTDGPFYYNSGELHSQQLPTYSFSKLQTALGRPVALFKIGSSVVLRSSNKSGFSVRAPDGSAVLGSGRSDILNKLKSQRKLTLSINPYPKINSLARGIVEREVFGNDLSRGSIYHKLRNYNGQVWRPLLGSFMSWYKFYKISSAISRALKGGRI